MTRHTLIALTLACVAGSTHAQPLRPIALTGTDGDLGPDLGAGIMFDSFALGNFLGAPSISTTGSITFGATLTSTDPAADTGIWAWRGGSTLSLVAREGQQVPTLDPGYVFDQFYTAPQIADTNVVLFEGSITGNDASPELNDCIFTERTGPLDVLIRERTTPVPAPVTGGVFRDPQFGTNPWVLSRQGAFAKRVHIFDAIEFPWGTWTDRAGALAKYFLKGENWTDGTDTFSFDGSTNPRINGSGAIVTANLMGPDGSGIWSDRALDTSGFGAAGVGQLEPIALAGDVAPGTGNTFGSFIGYEHTINGNGRVVFGAQFTPTGPGQPGGLWSDARFGVTQLIALSNTGAPGTTDAVFNIDASFPTNVVLSDNNVVAFRGQLRQAGSVGGSNDTGIWSTRSPLTGQPSNLRLVVREGANVPTSAGADYFGLRFGELGPLLINNSGRVAFVALLNDFTRSLWIENPDGTLTPLAKEFTTLDVFGDGTDFRLITEIDAGQSSASTGDGRRTIYNDAGDVVLRIVFADGSEGVFTTAPMPACDAPSVVEQPETQFVQPGGVVELVVNASGTGPLKHQWRRDGLPIQGAVRSTYAISAVGFEDAGSYDCIVSNACGDAVTDSAQLTVAPTCPADLNGDGLLNNTDINLFVSAFLSGQPVADINGDGNYNNTDINEFVQFFLMGCL